MPLCLIGEYDTFLSRLLSRYCEAAGFSVQRAQVGEELLTMVGELQPDLIILDAELPGRVRGWEVVETLNAAPDHAPPVIACSWLPPGEAARLASGCAAYLQKPDLHYDDFVRAVGAALKDAGFEPERP